MADKVDRMFAFVAEDESGDEGIVAIPMENIGIAPLVGCDMARVDSLRPHAQFAANVRKKPVRLIYFETLTEIEVFEPEKT